MNNIDLKIPVPCKENWNCMANAEHGKFCNTCNKVVVDFSFMTTEEIKNYFLQNTHKKVCGRFKASQVQQHHNKIQTILLIAYTHFENTIRYKLLKAGCLFFISCALALAGCGFTAGSTAIIGDTVYNPSTIDSTNIKDSNTAVINYTGNVQAEKPIKK